MRLEEFLLGRLFFLHGDAVEQTPAFLLHLDTTATADQSNTVVAMRSHLVLMIVVDEGRRGDVVSNVLKGTLSAQDGRILLAYLIL